MCEVGIVTPQDSSIVIDRSKIRRARSHQPFKSIADFFSVIYRFCYHKVDRLANGPFYHFWWTIVFVIFAGGPVLILVPGPALNGPVYYDEHEPKPERYFKRFNPLLVAPWRH